MKKIAPVFKLQPAMVFLVKEFDSIALFPHETSGKFNQAQVDLAARYEVRGEEVEPSTACATPVAKDVSPFGAFTGPTASLSAVPHRLPPLANRRKLVSSFRKTIMLVSLALQNPNKPSSSTCAGVDYRIVTQVVVTLEAGNCNISVVGGLIQQQVGFEVILLDSKCFPVLDSATTSSDEFWRCNRKILAASKSLYTKMIGSSANPERAREEETLETPPAKKQRLHSDSIETFTDKLDSILAKVGRLEQHSRLADELAKLLECVICKEVSQRPVYTPCCQRLVGCKGCIEHWLEDHGTCPHCSSAAINPSELKGLGETLSMIGAFRSERESPINLEARPPTVIVDSDDDSDFELPPSGIQLRRRQQGSTGD